jgi:hypothetical protein
MRNGKTILMKYLMKYDDETKNELLNSNKWFVEIDEDGNPTGAIAPINSFIPLYDNKEYMKNWKCLGSFENINELMEYYENITYEKDGQRYWKKD